MRHAIIQIGRWLMQPKVWRFVGFTSAVVGLLCYALSSSFNHLFGYWNLWKIILYTVFSFIISLLILYANIWKSSRSLRFKAHTAFLVLAITSVYSFFFDKVMNRKPDAYSLISCAAFAIMSMSLSRQSQCGFEVDLLYFFLGCLIVLLMKIKLQLFFVGAGFSYSLIIIRSSFTLINSTAENEYLELRDENSVVIEMNSLLSPSNDIFRMMQQFMACTNALQQESMSLVERLIEEYMQGMRDFEMDTLPSRKIHNLHEIVKLMVASGYEKECSDVYSSWRRVFLQECLINKIFGLQEAHTDPEDELQNRHYLNTMLARWMTACDVAMTILFPIEQHLCNRVFSGFSSAASSCFSEVCKEATSQLLCFADVFASGNPTNWRLFKMLQMFTKLHYLFPKFQSLFPDSTLLNEAITVKNRLGEASRDLFMEMHNVTFRVPAAKETVMSHGRLHPITVGVMTCLSSACGYGWMLKIILQEYPTVYDNEVEASSVFLKQIEQIMEMFNKKLISKSRNCKDPALRHIFMLNNRRHIEAINTSSGLELNFGKEWFQNNRTKIKQNLELYKRSSWNEVLDFLELDNNERVALNDNITEEILREKIHLFNSHFEEICRVQSEWFVYDNQIREEIISAVGNILLPAYGIFIGRLQDILANQAYKYIKYGMFEIQDRLNHLFMGNENIRI